MNVLFLTLLFPLFQSITPNQWIKQTLESYFSQYPDIPESKFCTSTYVAYKNDAMLVDMDGGITPQQFHKKWSKQFDTKRAGMSAGYFVSGTDFGKIRVTSCELLKTEARGTWWKVVLSDLDYKIKYRRDILIVKEKGQYKIADVKEYN
ncbi:MAG: hypothetical protein ACK4LB_04680 [Spirosomataceae bacterium]